MTPMKPLLSLAVVAGIPVAAMTATAIDRGLHIGKPVSNSIASHLRGGSSGSSSGGCVKMFQTSCPAYYGQGQQCDLADWWRVSNANANGKTIQMGKVGASNIFCCADKSGDEPCVGHSSKVSCSQ